MSINRTEIKGELKKSIVQALTSTFENVYPGYEVEIDYRCDRKNNNNRYFGVYLKGETFNVRDEIPMLKPHLIFVDRFINSDAIVFSEHPLSAFEEQNDFKEENMDLIREAVKKVQEEFKDKGRFCETTVSNSGYRVKFIVDLPKGKRLERKWLQEVSVAHYFSVVPISLKSAKSHASKIRSQIKFGIERVEKECSKE